MKPKLEILLAIRWNSIKPDSICRPMEILLDTLDKSDYKEELPLNWIIPSHPYLESKSPDINNLILEIKTRIHRLKDRPLSAGYSGALFPLLTLKELEKELVWSLSNPWNSGIKDVFAYDTPILFPEVADISRAGALELYRKLEFRFIGATAFYDLPGQRLQETLFQPLQLKAETNFKILKKEAFNLISQKRIIFYLNIIDSTNIAPLWGTFQKLLKILEKKTLLSFPSLEESLSENPSSVNLDAGNYSLLDAPALRERFSLAQTLRDQPIKIGSQYRNIINCFNPLKDIHNERNTLKKEKEQITFPPEERLNDCTMQGQTLLIGTDFSVEFNNGRINNIKDKGNTPLLMETEARSYIRKNNKAFPFENISSASISSEFCSGMRETQRIILPDNKLEGYQLTDYIFVDRFNHLLISSKVIYPFPEQESSGSSGAHPKNRKIKKNTQLPRLTPFEFPLFPVKKGLELILFTGDESVELTLIPETREKSYTLIAEMIAIHRDGKYILFGFPPEKRQNKGIIEITLTPRKNEAIAGLSIFNTYLNYPAPFPMAITEVFSFFLGVSYSKPDKLPFFPEEVLREIPSYCIAD